MLFIQRRYSVFLRAVAETNGVGERSGERACLGLGRLRLDMSERAGACETVVRGVVQGVRGWDAVTHGSCVQGRCDGWPAVTGNWYLVRVETMRWFDDVRCR